jgi:hypothetical protein
MDPVDELAVIFNRQAVQSPRFGGDLPDPRGVEPNLWSGAPDRYGGQQRSGPLANPLCKLTMIGSGSRVGSHLRASYLG